MRNTRLEIGILIALITAATLIVGLISCQEAPAISTPNQASTPMQPLPLQSEIPPKPDSLLCSDSDYYILYDTFKKWGYDFNALYETYSKKKLTEDSNTLWIGSSCNENQRAFFDRIGSQWKPRAIPTPGL